MECDCDKRSDLTLGAAIHERTLRESRAPHYLYEIELMHNRLLSQENHLLDTKSPYLNHDKSHASQGTR